MFSTCVILSLLASASAFAPAGKVATSALKMGFETEVGAQAPLGYWDPLGLLKDADQARFDRLRTVENKHGRIAMLAIVGHMYTAAGNRCGGDIAFGVPYSTMKTGLAAFDTIPGWGLAQLILFIGAMEVGFSTVEKDIAEDCTFRMKEFGWSEATQRKKSAIELNNGRAAQMGILGLMVHEKLNNDPYVLNAIFGSPVAFNQ
ncbi:fucoxanthin chlorophyll a /c binding protein [Ochromonadaceae sp. CCMP2298]|nr:fucoxanthin chlorophyll a /c binding protein [Ochromonadaceae sp. CCMP2298]|eukprot:CAMPEP_0173196706 /NCGR_PEP_ID=MMETSP1141-20130122/15764_1 /TAXON_ID=483371 /ORGANISM="non described non described, Strain CCMP2298" /LENGTH=202 /DNA_ID=CAMNT_0014121385 /DNA_START=38 /DNA_END=646 /DNA_ORIENTATION=-